MKDTLKKILEEKAARIESVPDKFLTQVDKAQLQAYNNILELLAELNVEGGRLVKSKKNFRIADDINAELKKVLKSTDYYDAVKSFVKDIGVQDSLTFDYFSKAFPKVKKIETEIAKEIKKRSQAEAIQVLQGISLDKAYIEPLKTVISEAVYTNADFKATLRTIRELAVGSKTKEGKLNQYATQVAYDTFAVSDRSYTQAISQDINAEWFFYSGDTLPTSREFCISRSNEYFSKQEVQAWAELKWGGKHVNTNKDTIFKYAGGYRCGNSIMPVSVFDVPKDVLFRNIKKGYFKPSKDLRKELDI